ncbi:MAG TPA: response regulator transcription factor [Thermoanaerobaculia bacterium]|nr:response regulator transcription factor [Thermoanaerobaculia bacterium]
MTKPRVLIADDHRMMAEGLKRLLAPHFEIVGLFRDGQELLAAASKLQPDVAVIDIAMPRLNGLQAIARLLEISPGTRIVVITMHGEPSYARSALREGALGFVLKASAPEDLIAAIRSALAGRVFVSDEIASELGGPGGLSGRGRAPGMVLTRRQTEVLRLLAAGKAAKEVAAVLGVSIRTVEFHKYKLMETLGIHSVAELVRFAFEQGLVAR